MEVDCPISRPGSDGKELNPFLALSAVINLGISLPQASIICPTHSISLFPYESCVKPPLLSQSSP
nr:hypothetical protein Q903MT_gene6597 [Picea sitchensis]